MTDRKQWRTGVSACFVGKIDEGVMEEYAKAEVKSMELSFGWNPAYYLEKVDWSQIPTWSRNTGTEVWSVHLPCSLAINESNLKSDIEILERAGDAGVKVALVHPSGEPIHDGNRLAMLEKSSEQFTELCKAAKRTGITVAVEDLPRTCLGNCHEDIQFFLDRNPELRICFDTNHLLKESNEEFIRAVGDKIVTLHVSDFDYVDEKHAFPGDGMIDWKSLQYELERVDYNGPFMYELTPKDKNGQRTLADVRADHLWLMNL